VLVILAMNGDGDAYGELVRRRQSSIRNMLRRLCRSDALADDIAQQAFVQGWQAIRQLKSRAALGAWLRKLAVNCWLQHIRSAKSEVELHEDLGTDSPIVNVNRRMLVGIAVIMRMLPRRL
jgi:DNA-directed RNA polymerase specialized sigma24 family protein